ncbi:endonuclease [uncultured phage cr151_1]|uniref:Uncharacterized protein n=1 Tax=uncultured phage cr151_1 TaxID=2986406 RepID=A0AAE7RWT2_9CAUD|nr:endonuclease [uncultured phage cr151_1]QWM89388.1 hypothetical protein [uncultured phage cr151_1]
MIKEETIRRYDELEIDKKYQEGMSTTEICKTFKISWNQLHQYFIIKGVQTRPAKRRESLRPKAPIGRKFGLWTVVSEEVKSGNQISPTSNSRNLYWLVQCECGELAWRNSAVIQSGNSTRCKRCGNKVYIDDTGIVKVNSIILSKYNQTIQGLPTRRHRSRKPELTFNISVEYLNKLYEEQEHVCALSGISLEPDLNLTMQQQNMSIDRINSDIGYEEGNIQWVDKRINMMKGSLSNEEFIELCTKVANYNKNKD